MRVNNTTSPTFGTRVDIGFLQQGRLTAQSTKFLDGIILAGADASRNGVEDSLLLKLSRKNPQNTGDGVADAFANFAPKAADQLELIWSAPNDTGRKLKTNTFDLSVLNKKTANQVKKTILNALKKFQPATLQAKAKTPERLRARDVIKHADLLVQASPEKIEMQEQGRTFSKNAEKAFYLVKKYGFEDAGLY